MKYVLSNCNLFDGNKNSEIVRTNIYVEDGVIVSVDSDSIKEGYEVIDLKDKYVMPGLVNLHAHLFGSGKPSKVLGGGSSQQKLVKFAGTKIGSKVLLVLVKNHVKKELYSGVTTLRSSGDFYYSDVKVRDLINKNKCVGPRLIVPGPAITVSGGHGDGTFAITGNTKEELENLVKLNKEHNVDYIKICVTGGVMDAKKKGEPGELKMNYEQTKAVCDKAHEYGYKVASHTESNEGIKVALKAGVDTIEHGSNMDDNDIKLFKDKGAIDVLTISPSLPLATFDPTITKLDEMCIYNSNYLKDGMINGAKKCLEEDVTVGLGTDASCPFVTPYDMWREVYYFAKYAGVSNTFALHTATLVNAKILGLDKEIGSIEVGKRADIIVCDNDFLKDIKELKNLSMVIKNGVIYKNVRIKKNRYIESKLDTLL